MAYTYHSVIIVPCRIYHLYHSELEGYRVQLTLAYGKMPHLLTLDLYGKFRNLPDAQNTANRFVREISNRGKIEDLEYFKIWNNLLTDYDHIRQGHESRERF